EIETPSGDPACIAVMANLVATHLKALGAEVDIITTEGGPSVHARLGDTSAGQPLFVVGHCDTVWPNGTLARKPFRIEDGRMYGPGVFDMKSGIAIVLEAIHALKELNRRPARPLEIFFSCDEEQGSHSTRSLIEEIATRAAAAL